MKTDLRDIFTVLSKKAGLKMRNNFHSTQKTLGYIELSTFAVLRFYLRLTQAKSGFHPGKINTSFI